MAIEYPPVEFRGEDGSNFFEIGTRLLGRDTTYTVERRTTAFVVLRRDSGGPDIRRKVYYYRDLGEVCYPEEGEMLRAKALVDQPMVRVGPGGGELNEADLVLIQEVAADLKLVVGDATFPENRLMLRSDLLSCSTDCVQVWSKFLVKVAARDQHLADYLVASITNAVLTRSTIEVIFGRIRYYEPCDPTDG